MTIKVFEFIKKNQIKLLLSLILILAPIIRIWNLQNNPAGFFCDEASIGYNAYSLLKTGRDEYGKSWPLFFRAFGEYKNPVQIYSTIPFVAFLGLNEFSVRLPSATYGTLTVLVAYLLVKEMFFSSRLRSTSKEPKPTSQEGSHLEARTSNFEPLITALLLAISPWHIHFSRIAFELMPFAFFTTLGTWLFLKALRAKNQFVNFQLSILNFQLALYSYSPARIFIPLFLAGLIIFFRKSLKIKTLVLGGFFFFLLSLPLLFHIKSGQGLSRWQQVSVFKEKTFSQAFAQMKKNYLAHFSLDFLFKKGDAGMNFLTRHSVKGLGELYWFELPLIIFGIGGLIFSKKFKELILLSWWLALYPLGSVVTADATPQATRSIIGVIPFQIFSAVGFSHFLNLIKSAKTYVRPRDRRLQRTLKSTILPLICLFLITACIGEFVRYTNLYFHQYPKYSSDYWGWQWGPRKIMEHFLAEKDNYDELYMTGQFNAPYIFLKFYDPKGECKNCFIGGLDRFNPNKRQLFAVRKEEMKELENQGAEFKIKKIFYYPGSSNSDSAFFLGEAKLTQGANKNLHLWRRTLFLAGSK